MPEASQSPVAIVTAASKGIGAACARRLASQGWRVALLSRSEGGEALAKELGGVSVRGDITNPMTLDALVGETIAEYGRIDGAVINTGHPAKGPLLEITDEQWTEGFELLFLSTARLVRRIAPHMIENSGGSIVSISTAWADAPALQYPISSPIRAGLSGYVKLASDELSGKGVRINAILPGLIDSQTHDKAQVGTIPMHRVGSVDEIARAVAFLLSEESAYITGQSIRVDGGIIGAI